MEETRKVSEALPRSGSRSYVLDIAWMVFSRFEFLARFFKVLYSLAYAKHCLGNNIRVRWGYVRRARGHVFQASKNHKLIRGLPEFEVDAIMEGALQRGDFKVIRVLLNYEGYGISIDEPNSQPTAREFGHKESEDFPDVEIQITPEEYELWKAPLESHDLDSTLKCSPIQKAFGKVMSDNISLQLEQLIQRREVETLRMLLRIYGHSISPPYMVNQGEKP